MALYPADRFTIVHESPYTGRDGRTFDRILLRQVVSITPGEPDATPAPDATREPAASPDPGASPAPVASAGPAATMGPAVSLAPVASPAG